MLPNRREYIVSCSSKLVYILYVACERLIFVRKNVVGTTPKYSINWGGKYHR